MQGDKDIFQQFNEEQGAWDEAPAPELWDALEARLDENPEGHPGSPTRPFVVVSVIVLALLAGAFFPWQPGEKPAEDAQTAENALHELRDVRRRLCSPKRRRIHSRNRSLLTTMNRQTSPSAQMKSSWRSPMR